MTTEKSFFHSRTSVRWKEEKKCFCADLQRSTYISCERIGVFMLIFSLSHRFSLRFYASLCCIYAQIDSLFFPDLFDVHNLRTVNQNRQEWERKSEKCMHAEPTRSSIYEREENGLLEISNDSWKGRNDTERDENFTIFCSAMRKHFTIVPAHTHAKAFNLPKLST